MNIEKHFNESYPQFKNEGAGNSVIIFNLLPMFLSEIKTAWGISDMDISENGFGIPQIEGSSVLFYAENQKNPNGLLAFCEDGNIHHIHINTVEADGHTWNGDDMYYKNIKTVISKSEVVEETCENMKEIMCSDFVLTAEKMENLAAEMVSVARDFWEL